MAPRARWLSWPKASVNAGRATDGGSRSAWQSGQVEKVPVVGARRRASVGGRRVVLVTLPDVDVPPLVTVVPPDVEVLEPPLSVGVHPASTTKEVTTRKRRMRGAAGPPSLRRVQLCVFSRAALPLAEMSLRILAESGPAMRSD